MDFRWFCRDDLPSTLLQTFIDTHRLTSETPTSCNTDKTNIYTCEMKCKTRGIQIILPGKKISFIRTINTFFQLIIKQSKSSKSTKSTIFQEIIRKSKSTKSTKSTIFQVIIKQSKSTKSTKNTFLSQSKLSIIPNFVLRFSQKDKY